MSFKIETLSNRVVKAGKMSTVESFIIVDEQGQFVSGTKEYATAEDAQKAIDGLAGYAEGLAFATAQFPGQAEKARIGKANVISEYLAWVAGGRPVKELEEPQAESAAEADAPVETAAASEVEEF